MNIIVTTSGRPSNESINHAKAIAKTLNIAFVRRNKVSVESVRMTNKADAVVVVGKDKLSVKTKETTFFFHPNTAMFRAKKWLKTGKEPLIDACKLTPGDTLYDATLGLGSDAILASLAVGHTGKVLGTEASSLLAFIVKEGLQSYETDVQEFNKALKRIKVMNLSHIQWLQKASTNSVDIVYFDPMFEEKVSGSDGFDSMRPFTLFTPLTETAIIEAKRVARKRVVLKDHFRSQRFQQFGFQVQVRPSATYHYGTIELEGIR
ncbi:class I SAM-dependent methyltransferase [Evansella sp. AB-rgal1]|uniref:class I SAM-dependent methyltransferase n=1 Tax=Evansella sp. AB-rgal1 TaxID=3242696 RepID=UPI00359CBB22